MIKNEKRIDKSRIKSKNGLNNKIKIPNYRQKQMAEITNKIYDLEDRTLVYAKGVTRLCRMVKFNVITSELIKQLVRSACSVGANYREANESLSKKDFLHRMKIARKECKESGYWLEILLDVLEGQSKEIEGFMRESRELRNIFSAIINKTAGL